MTEKLRVLNELRPASEGFAGIPQETRILHSMLLANAGIQTTGLLNGNVMPHRGVIAKQSTANRDPVYYRAAAVLELAEIPEGGLFNGPLLQRLRRFGTMAALKLSAVAGRPLPVYPVDLSQHVDFVWRRYFAKSLSPGDFNAVAAAPYAAILPSWHVLQAVGIYRPMRGRYARIDTSAYDVFLAQTPWPSVVPNSTQLVVRYHDAIPIFYPHTISNPRRHQFTHYFPLKSNLANGAIYVCNSENSRSELLRIFPVHEKQTRVIPCCIPDMEMPQQGGGTDIGAIIRPALEHATEPGFGSLNERQRFYARHLRADMRYLVMVSTIEPRKNHTRLIAAWNHIRTTTDPDLRLVIVGVPGWNHGEIIAAMRPFQENGLIFNVSRLAPAALGQLYRGAAAVVCPSIAEGFDLSGVEAMAAGGAVAASDIPVHREIYRDACEYFSPYSTSEAAAAIQRVIGPGNEARRAALVEAGAAVAARYRRAGIAPMWENLFEDIAGARARRRS